MCLAWLTINVFVQSIIKYLCRHDYKRWLYKASSHSAGCKLVVPPTPEKDIALIISLFPTIGNRRRSREGGHEKISSLAINEICCSITDWFCFEGTRVISSSAREQKRPQRSNLTRSQPILRPQRTARPNYKNIRDPCFNVRR